MYVKQHEAEVLEGRNRIQATGVCTLHRVHDSHIHTFISPIISRYRDRSSSFIIVPHHLPESLCSLPFLSLFLIISLSSFLFVSFIHLRQNSAFFSTPFFYSFLVSFSNNSQVSNFAPLIKLENVSLWNEEFLVITAITLCKVVSVCVYIYLKLRL